ncbi:class I SAM-dependent methyltransferase [Marinobacterium mangrovicola]|uniref:Methyltransferase family protein n=1 Tax=Marinobacterium mangrovicola TaxID=1476959 RepID=A0A4R1GK39_9GAMM|nr:class I SAM-dependent methyltransferase [Marinobacterium mangrovicola]TCK07255.1 methyltransferase family protein [Marinobacterium mangrovicola]
MTKTLPLQEAAHAIAKASVLAGRKDVSSNLKHLLDKLGTGADESWNAEVAGSDICEEFFELQSRVCFPIGLSAWYAFDEGLGVYHRESLAEFTYSDGDEVEDRIFNAVKSAEQVGLYSKELLKHQIDWPSEYHLSADRANLLRPFANQLAFGHVLELGCGCGAVTRYLGELGARVTAVEGSPRRAAIAAERCRDLANVQVAVDKIESFPIQGKYDVVTLIGVLEYSRVYVEGDDPVQQVLERARSYLKPGGVLIVAIENQLGLKYFAGAPEDHGVGVMSGINDLYTNDSPVTFGRLELEQRAASAGFSHAETFSPFPDYKLPNFIVAPEAAEKAPHTWNLGTLLASSVSADRQRNKNSLFSLRRAWPLVAKNRLVEDLANSHLMLAHTQPGNTWQEKDSLAYYYSPKRGASTSQELAFHKNTSTESGISVWRRNIGNTLLTAGDAGWREEPYQPGEVHSDLLQAVLQRPGWTLDMVCEWAETWITSLRRAVMPECVEGLVPEGWQGYQTWLPAHFLDAAPRNLIIKPDDSTVWIDLEWKREHPLPIELVVFRGLFVTFYGIKTVAAPANTELLDGNVLLHRVMEHFGYKATAGDLRLFSKVMHSIACHAEGRVPSEGGASLDSVRLPVWSTRTLKPTLTADCTVYWRAQKQGFSEERSCHHPLALDGNKYTFGLHLPEALGEGGELRLDISNRPGVFLVDALELVNADGNCIWQWAHDGEGMTGVAQMKLLPGQGGSTSVFLSEGYDPQCILRIPEPVFEQLAAGTVLRLVVAGASFQL